ncbi:hypothetical protein FIBSPDRAFT_840120 [Athelia psychrophila]|uniref:BTB domain-containing protein n=1 Tax=Athelia psychrophila TaxID=1759441 RepID=A0A165XKE2_9AGAM|nr:hypothetical protein FIBSPDRAFT_840120 [Fibularhizoctonia sp. CBS 109695]
MRASFCLQRIYSSWCVCRDPPETCTHAFLDLTQVANTLYSVPRSPFERHSSAFAGKGLTRENPMVLEDVAAAHLDNLLSLLYPSEYGVYTATSVEEWTSILHLAVRWGFESIKNLSIECLSPIASDIDKIVLGRQYAIDEWLGDAYLAICSRDQCLSREEGMRMEKEDIIEISAIRHQFGLGAQAPLDRRGARALWARGCWQCGIRHRLL